MAEKCKITNVYRKIRKRDETEIVQDVIFFIVELESLSGNFISKTDIQENLWMTETESSADPDMIDDYQAEHHISNYQVDFEENIGVADGF